MCSSQAVAEKLAKDLSGRIKLEDAGFDWKVLGPDVRDFDYVAWTSDQVCVSALDDACSSHANTLFVGSIQDAYACSGQKCSAQSVLFMHKNWVDAGIEKKLAELASRRKLSDLTIGPVLTVTTKRMLDHAAALLKIPGARVAFGAEELGTL
jgi:1-pyrroline-5-carboxylate dehydrogenase